MITSPLSLAIDVRDEVAAALSSAGEAVHVTLDPAEVPNRYAAGESVAVLAPPTVTAETRARYSCTYRLTIMNAGTYLESWAALDAIGAALWPVVAPRSWRYVTVTLPQGRVVDALEITFDTHH